MRKKNTAQRSWNETAIGQLLELAAPGGERDTGDLYMTRIAPGDGIIAVEWQHQSGYGQLSYTVACEVREAGGSWQEVVSGRLSESRTWDEGRRGSLAVAGLDNGHDYRIRVRAARADGGRACESPPRLARTGAVPGSVVNYIHPEDHFYGFSGRSPASPSIVRLPDGNWLASHDVYWAEGGQCLTQLFRSGDEGQSWQYVTSLYPCFWGKLFLHRGSLYMMATSTEYGALLIGRSDDGGDTWSPPVELIRGGSREEGGPHKAPMPVIAHAGRLWTAIDYGSWTTGGHRSSVISAAEDADLLDAASWSLTPPLAYNPDWPGTVERGTPYGLLEGSALVDPEGRLAVIYRYQTNGGSPAYGRSILLRADEDDPGAPLTFHKVVDFHGNLSKFSVYYDAKSQKYWSLVNRVSSANLTQRNLLTLICSTDLEQWSLCRDVLDYEHNGWPEDSMKVGFQYVDWTIVEDELCFLSRTALHNANSFHDANYITFHRIADFRAITCCGSEVRDGTHSV